MSIKQLIASAMLAASVLVTAVPVAMAADLPDFSSIVESEGKAVVNISTTSTVKEMASGLPDGVEGDPFFEFFRRFAPQVPRERQENSLGSGFIISPDGYVMTNAHVVARADKITVKLTDKREFQARVIGSDARSDVALLKIDAKNLPVVRLGNPKALKVGQWVLAIGSPFGFENTATSGIVSGKNRMLPDESAVQFIQTDAAVNPGNSGGPLFNLSGEVVGINSQIYSRSGGFMGISFAIPIDTAMNVADQLKAKGKVTRSRIGVVVQELSKELAASFGLSKPSGALINAVDPKGPAQKAGLKAGDIILRVNGQDVSSSADLQRLISNETPGKAITLDVWRSRAQISIRAVPEELKEEDSRIAQREYRKPGEPGEQSLAQIGLRLQELNPMQLKQAGIDYGLLVRAANGAAMRAGIQPGDIIVGIGGEPLKSFAQLKRAMEQAKKGGNVALQILRQGVTQFVPLTVGGE
ncbi:DegQ family serine endoprotease [Chromobacterium paludis]|uniref:Probable periplasmic serine endoprotease DegP-like n=1 Tax=Chromobacterium paludis TaxID=2605945 RepID=A0A5C1DHC6_9NEIS|nr:DegQ family serine endoprotease [Chromobacterium paludis]QEL55008.1 DegQ family serine endoprotease [Chromobacterium paludis]